MDDNEDEELKSELNVDGPPEEEGEAEESLTPEELYSPARATEEVGEFREEEEEGEELGLAEEDVVYESKYFVSGPYLSAKGDLPTNVVVLDSSFGYDCKRYFNLSVIDTDVLIFASGTLIHFINTKTNEKWYRRCHSGVGIGHITVNPVEPHVAVAERGENPLIIIYEWPGLDIVTILRRGTKTAYSHINYSVDGELLCSQGSSPDYMVTVWNWRKHRIMLRAKAFGQEIFNARFSLYVPSHLTTSGTSHIRFWKMARTFTGLKLQGELGRFGKSEICNIVGFIALPDEKVMSGCEWGNILVWDEGLIRVEVLRRGRTRCHDAPITQFMYDNGELTTVAMDGSIKVWYYETIELADPPEDDRYVEVEPILEYEVGDFYHKAELMALVKCTPDPENYMWFAQDGNGGIWKLELSTSLTAMKPKQMFTCHAGHVMSVQSSPFSSHFMSLGKDGRVFLYDYKKKEIVLDKEFMAGGRSLLWLPLNAEESGSVVVGGFEDGVIRVLAVSIQEHEMKKKPPSEEYINLIQVSKPHTKPVTVVTVNPVGSLLVTASEDATIFVYLLVATEQFPEFTPIGFIPVTGSVSTVVWNPVKDNVVLVGCTNGTVMEITVPTARTALNPTTYLLKNVPTKQLTFVSVKSEIRRELRLKEIEKEKEDWLEQKKEELEKLYLENPGVNIDEEVFFSREEEEKEPELPPIYIPEVPNAILFAVYTVVDTIWLSMAGYDAGYMYEYVFGKSGPVRSTLIHDADDVEIHCCHYYHNGQYLVLGLQGGRIRVIHVNPLDHTDLSNYWELTMHDNLNGRIQHITFSPSYQYMFSCGSDGNVFSYVFTPDAEGLKAAAEYAPTKGFPDFIVHDIDDPKAMSLEQTKAKIEYDRKMRVANAYKREVLEKLKEMEMVYAGILKANNKLPKSQQLKPEELILDLRVVDDLETHLRDEMALVKKKLAWHIEKSRYWYFKLRDYFIDDLATLELKVEGIEVHDWAVSTFRQRRLGDDYTLYTQLILKAMEEYEARGRAHERLYSEEEVVEIVTRRPNPVTALMKQIMSLCGDYKRNIKLRRLLRKYRDQKDKIEDRRIEWIEMMKKKPDPTKLDPDDIASIGYAKETIGDYKLKTASDYKVPKHMKVNTVNMYNELLRIRKDIFNAMDSYNQRVLELRQRKLKMIERHTFLRQKLLEIAKEIPKSKIRNPPDLPTFIENIEYPERDLVWTEEAVFEELPKRYQQLYQKTELAKTDVEMLDEEYEMILLEQRGQELGKVHAKLGLLKYTGISGVGDLEELELEGEDDAVPTAWEKECMQLRCTRRLYQQDAIIDEMETGIKEFDEDIFNLKEARIQVELDVKLLEIALLTVHQEVLILKKFEAKENEKLNKVHEKLGEKHDIQKRINDIQSKVDAKWRDIRRCEEDIKNLVTVFHATIADNKFYDFLRRIFKKKYRPPKVQTDSDESESESESSSESEEEDAKSLDSKDLGPIRLDENTCPAGCDVQLYNLTFTKRSERHTFELAVAEEKRQIEMLKKDTDNLLKKIRQVDMQYNVCQKDFEDFQREKQVKLNEVETVVVLRLNQFHNLQSPHQMEKMADSVCFSSETLSKLYARVGELLKDTDAQKAKHTKNQQHLMRLKTDIKYMEETIAKLEKGMKDAMIKKFGTVVDTDELQESLLKRLVAEMYYIVTEMEREFDKQLKGLRDKLQERKDTYAMKLQENSERYHILTVLEEERLKLGDLLDRQDKLKSEKKVDTDAEHQADIHKLHSICRMQEDRITTLRLEIKMLRLKVRPVAPIVGLYATDVPETVQRILIQGCDGELYEISEDTKHHLQDIYGEALEVTKDIKDGAATDDDYHRLRQLTGKFLEKIPSKALPGIARRMSQQQVIDHELAVSCAQGLLHGIVRNIRTESFLEAMDIVGEVVESIIENVGECPQPY